MVSEENDLSIVEFPHLCVCVLVGVISGHPVLPFLVALHDHCCWLPFLVATPFIPSGFWLHLDGKERNWMNH